MIIGIVEDNVAVRHALKLVLEISGYGVDEFENGRDLLECDDISHLSCIIMDVHLPGESGLQTLERLQNRSVTVPVFIVTGRVDAFIRKESRRLDAAGFFEKPVPADVLINAIAAVLGGAAPVAS